MGIENDLRLFLESYKPVLECIMENSEPFPLERVTALSANLHLPAGWNTVSFNQLSDIYYEAEELREEDGKGKPLEIALIHQVSASQKRIRWMDELCSFQGVLGINEMHIPKWDFFIRYVSIPLEKGEGRFVPRFNGKNALIFVPAIEREWAEKGFLANTYIDSSLHGRLCADFEEMDGRYYSAELIKNAEKRGSQYLGEPLIEMGLIFTETGTLAVNNIFFGLECLGKGEVDSFLRHVGYNRP